MLTKTSKAIRLATLGLATAGAFTFAQTASAEVEVAGSVSIANMYLWRGQDLGNGTGAISGDLVASVAGAYAGIWGSSGDTAAGTEYDLFVGYGMEMGDFNFDVSVWTYEYPNGDGPADDFGNLSEVIVTLGAGPVSFSYYDNVAGGTGYEYYTLSGEVGAFSATIGHAAPESEIVDAANDGELCNGDAVVGSPVKVDCGYTHLDLSYAYNDNLSFTLSQVLDTKDDLSIEDDLHFVVSYSLPL